MYLVLLAVVSTVCASRVVLEPEQDVRAPRGWTLVGRAPPDQPLLLTFAIKQQNLAQLEEKFWSVSDPSSASYAQYLTLDDITQIVQPTENDVTTVRDWLAEHGVFGKECHTNRNGDFLQCEMSVVTCERLLGTEMGVFTHELTTTVRALSQYTVPSNVARTLDFVGGVHRFPDTSRNLRTVNDVGATAASLRRAYKVDSAYGNNTGNIQAVAQFLHQYFSPADLLEFMTLYGENFKHLDKVTKVIGPDHALPAGTEASLDIQYIMALGASVPTWFWSTPKLHENQEPFLTWMLGVNNLTVGPYVHSVSYGDDEDSLDASYMVRINAEFQKAGLRGISIMFASGDSGCGCNANQDSFVPSFPATSPYVTAVGGTIGSEKGDAETGDSISGGGFSNKFPMPAYQTAAIAQYLKTGKQLPDPKLYNKTGRAYPDVSARSEGYIVVVDLLDVPVAGTSCACPCFSGIVSLVNDARLNAGKPTLGFLNPLLYSKSGAGMTDSTEGCNMGCPQIGFCAAPGWDPVTGWGTPDFSAMLSNWA